LPPLASANKCDFGDRVALQMSGRFDMLNKLTTPSDVRDGSWRRGLDSEDFRDVEKRLETLKIAVEDFRDSSWTAWSGAGSQIREAASALCLKQEALFWKLRVAKHTSGFAQRVLLDDIIISIQDLEETVAWMLKPA